MRYAVSITLAIVALIHLLPLSGVLGAARLSALYGLDFSEPNLAVLMRHRAVLFGLLSAFLLYAAFRPEIQGLALLAGWLSVLSFLGLAWQAGGLNPALTRVVTADLVALVALVIGTGAWWMGARPGS